MNWRKLDETLRRFAASHEMQLDIKDVAGGQVTKYRMSEHDLIFYELTLAKPIESRGSKFRVLSEIKKNKLNIKLTRSLFGHPNLIIESLVDLEIRAQIDDLANKIDRFSWTSHINKTTWPPEIKNIDTLEFECNQIDLKDDTLDLIRNIHIRLTGSLRNVSA